MQTIDPLIESIVLTSSVFGSHVRCGRIDIDPSVYASSYVMARAFNNLFPSTGVCDGIYIRLSEETGDQSYGEKGYFHYREGRSRSPIAGQLKIIPHSWLSLDPQSKQLKSSQIIDVVPVGSMSMWIQAQPLQMSPSSPAFVETDLSHVIDLSRHKRSVAIATKALLVAKEEIENIVRYHATT